MSQLTEGSRRRSPALDRLLVALGEMRRHQGQPSYRMIEKAAQRAGRVLPKSTINRILVGDSWPRWESVESLAIALQGDIALIKQLWLEADHERNSGAAQKLPADEPIPDAPIANSVASLLDSIKDVEEAVILIGALLIVKSENKVLVRVIDNTTSNLLNNSRDLLSDPVKTLKFLADHEDGAQYEHGANKR